MARIWNQKREATHVIVAVDTFDYEDYPVYVSKEEDVNVRVNRFKGKSDKVMEVYNLSMDIEMQLNAPRAWNL